LMMIDVSRIDNALVGDEVVLMGRDGNEEISCAELARTVGTIPWEITTRVGQRVRRVFV
jgi:alanine racemase